MTINPDHGPECTGIHQTGRPFHEVCPAAIAAHRARGRALTDRRRDAEQCINCGVELTMGGTRCDYHAEAAALADGKYRYSAKGILTATRYQAERSQRREDALTLGMCIAHPTVPANGGRCLSCKIGRTVHNCLTNLADEDARIQALHRS